MNNWETKFNYLPSQEEENNPEKKLETFVKEMSEKISAEYNIPILANGRINFEEFKDIYSESIIEEDKKFLDELENKFKNEKLKFEKEASLNLKKSPDQIEEIEEEDLSFKPSEKLEMFKFAIFNKFLSKKGITLRSSRYDDVKNGFDNLILEKESGNVICALDEICNIKGPYYEEKVKKFLEKNKIQEGAKIKYGLKFQKEKEKFLIKKCQLQNVPLFYISLPQESLEKGTKTFIPNLEEYADYEKKIMKYFISSLMYQIRRLELEPKLSPKINENIIKFKRFLKEIEKTF
ncbi:MAG: hypothetical protein ACPLXL_01425 [Minisyncoccia bacterium]